MYITKDSAHSFTHFVEENQRKFFSTVYLEPTSNTLLLEEEVSLDMMLMV